MKSPEPTAGSSDITEMLHRWSAGDRDALDRVLPLVYQELRQIAVRQLKSEPEGHSLDPTDLVHALYLKLIDQRRASWANRAHFYGVVAGMMRRILVDHARSRLAAKRGATTMSVSLTTLLNDPVADDMPVSDVLAIDRALERLGRHDAEHARIVELRFFAGLSIEETAYVLDRSPATIKRAWRLAKAWLYKDLRLPSRRRSPRFE
jgi:RNA polymerase sigma factor (TIGR02999 family)